MYLDMANQVVDGKYTSDGQVRRTAPACVGAAMAAGSTEDGPAIEIFTEGTRNPMIDALGGIDTPTPQWLSDAQAPKLVLVPVGLLPPDGWVPHVLKIQIIRIGDVYVVGGPAEFTIVSGLRIRRTVAEELGVPLENVIFNGYANAYSSYCTTPEEYDAQQYEGGSTLFGRNTLPAYQQVFAALAAAMKAGPTSRAARRRAICPASSPASDASSPSTHRYPAATSATSSCSPRAASAPASRWPSSSSPATPRTTCTVVERISRCNGATATGGPGTRTTATGPPSTAGAGRAPIPP